VANARIERGELLERLLARRFVHPCGIGDLLAVGGAHVVDQFLRLAREFEPSIPSLDDSLLLERLDEWLPPLLGGKRKLGDIAHAHLVSAMQQLLGYDALRQLDRLAPGEFVSPAGSHHAIDYSSVAGPTVEVRAQALFGLAAHPMICGGRVPLILAITSPAGRPIQTTKDLPGFWSGSWRDVAKDMRGRYPKHPWPDDPASAAPTLKSKRASGAA
jgi:ATP-dependent helicase HrpB